MEHRKDIVGLMNDCIGCGECNVVCPSYNRGGCDPMAVLKGDESKVKGCIGCGECSEVCTYTDPWKVMMYMNCHVNGLEVPQVFRDTGYHIPKGANINIPPADYYDRCVDVYLAPGCLVNGVVPFLENAGVRALDAVGMFADRLDTGCCTFPVHYRSMTDEERDSIKREGTKGSDGKKVVTLCPGCSNEFASSGIDCIHIVEALHSNLEAIEGLVDLDMKVCIQPGCHLRHLEKEFRDVVEATGATIVDAPIGCCVKVVPGISESIMEERQKDMEGADAVIVGCPSCFIRYDSYENGIPVLHISELVAMCTGYEETLRFHRN